jgi:transcriptional regulator with GAF, ATPase, and Fis domain
MHDSILMGRRFLAGAAAAVVLYCLCTLAVLATIPDLRLRFVLVDADVTIPFVHGAGGHHPGITVHRADGLEGIGEPLIQPGDRLLQLGTVRVDSFVDYAREILALRNAEILPGGKVLAGTDPLQPGLPPLIQEEGGKRWIRVRFQRSGTGQLVENALALQAVPLGEAALTFLWFLSQLLIFGVGLLAFWSRPFDRSAKLFFAMCLTTLGAFVGGFHWWIIVGSLWLTVPFVICAVLLPVVALHFFLTFPRPKPVFVRHPHITLIAIYAVPALTLASLLAAEIGLWRWVWQPESVARTEAILSWLKLIRYAIYIYLAVAAVYFVATLLSLVHARYTTRNPVELNQVNSILWAGFIATGFIGYTLLLAYFHRTEFALGGGRIPMFLASLVFMLAYAIGIVRFKLMLVEQIISRGMWYYILTCGSTAVVSAGIAAGAMAISSQSHLLPPNLQAVFVAGILMTGVALVLWLRDGWQRAIDRRFFREKYRLDKALRRMNRAEGQLADTQVLAEQMLNSCRDVLQADRAALYLRGDKSSYWRLTCALGNVQRLPIQVPVSDALLQTLTREGTVQRTLAAPETAPEQTLLRQLHVDLIHGLEMDGVVSGFVALGTKRGGGAYSAEDLTFLTALGQMTGVALHNAKVQQDLGHLNEELRLKLERIAQQKQQILMLQAELAAARPDSRTDAAGDFRREMIIGNSPALNRVMETVRKVAASETSVLLRGESGTGKELVAHVIHENSSRRSGPFVAVHCAALAPSLLESELFGHVKGAFTGAQADRRGRFELAHGGTIFLDEIGDISPETQVKLLRVLQEHEFERVGGGETLRVDVRVIAATHRNLEQLIAEGRFREDLYYRLNVISITLPPLRERLEDILELAMQFLKGTASRSGKPVVGFDDDVVEALMRYSWPGNIRELENVIERAVVLADGPTVTLADLPADLTSLGRPLPKAASGSKSLPRASSRPEQPAEGPDWRRMDEDSERELLLSALERCRGNKASAARLLGLPRSTFFSKLKKYAIAE